MHKLEAIEALENIPQENINALIDQLRATYGDSFATKSEAQAMKDDINHAVDNLSNMYRAEIEQFIYSYFKTTAIRLRKAVQDAMDALIVDEYDGAYDTLERALRGELADAAQVDEVAA
jgi:hypothetical protein